MQTIVYQYGESASSHSNGHNAVQVLREKDKVSPIVPSHEHDNMPNFDVDLVYIELRFPIGICNMYDGKVEELGLLFVPHISL